MQIQSLRLSTLVCLSLSSPLPTNYSNFTRRFGERVIYRIPVGQKGSAGAISGVLARKGNYYCPIAKDAGNPLFCANAGYCGQRSDAVGVLASLVARILLARVPTP